MNTGSMDPDSARKLRLREETENPFRKVRMFGYGAAVASASVGFLIAATRLLAKGTGVQGGQEVDELLQNVGIDLGAMVLFSVLLRNEYAVQAKTLERMAQGARIASLRVRAQVEGTTKQATLSDFRRGRGMDKRLVIFVGSDEIVEKSLIEAEAYSEKLVQNDLLSIPVAISLDGDGKLRCTGGESAAAAAAGRPHVALPAALNQWQEWAASEVEAALAQGVDVQGQGLTFVIKKNGRVGQRAVGSPPWRVFIGDVEDRQAAGMDVTNI